MRVMVTGAGGLLGHAVVPVLRAKGDDVHAFTHAELDVTDGAKFTARATAVKPDWIFHLAAWAKVDDCEADPARAHRVNAEGSRHAAEAAKAAGAALLAISSDYVFDGTATTPWHEDDPTGPLNAYGASKLEGERAIRATGVRHLVVRTAWLFGDGGGNFVDSILKRARSGAPLAVVDDQRGSPTYTPDLAEGLRRLAGTAENGTYHVVNEGTASWHDLAAAAVKEAGLAVDVGRTTTAALARPARRPAYSALATGKFAAATGWKLPHWTDAVARHVRTSREGAAA